MSLNLLNVVKVKKGGYSVSKTEAGMNLFEEIRKIVSEQLGVKPEDVKPESSFINDLGSDRFT